MSCACKSSVDAHAPPVRVRATYANLYKPESTAEYLRSMSVGGGGHGPGRTSAVDIVCRMRRQDFLRSYTFTREKESTPQRSGQFLRKLRERAALLLRPDRKTEGATAGARQGRRKKGNLRGVPSSAFSSIFHRLLSCTTSTDVVDRRRPPSTS